MKKNEVKKFTQFELLSENSNGLLVSGFSKVMTSSIIGGVVGTNDHCTVTNNCNGGNCKAGCSYTGNL